MKYIYILLLIPLFVLLTGCETQEDVDKLVTEYVRNELGIEEFEIVYRGGKDESNMGDRSYIVKSKTEPYYEFSVHLEGLLESKVVGDNLEEVKEAYQLAGEFRRSYIKSFEKIGYTDFTFRNANTDITTKTELEVKVKLNETLTLNDERTIQNLYSYIQLLLDYNNKLDSKGFIIYSMVVDYPLEGEEERISFYNSIPTITDYETLKAVLLKNGNFVNQALFVTNQLDFTYLEDKVKELGFSYADGFNTRSINCNQEELNGMQCTGYSLRLSGSDKSDINLDRLKTMLKEFKLPIKRVVIPNEGGAILIEL